MKKIKLEHIILFTLLFVSLMLYLLVVLVAGFFDTLSITVLVWILGFGVFSVLAKKKIADLLKQHYKLPRVINYFLLLTPLVLIEEFLTCELPYLACVSITLPVFYLLFAITYLIQAKTKIPWLATAILFCFFCWVNEFLFVGRIFVYDLLTTAIFSIIVFMVYAVLATLPSYYLESTFEKAF